MRSVDFYTGLVRGVVDCLSITDGITISEEKRFSYHVMVDAEGWKVIFEWCIGWEKAPYSGCSNPDEPDEPVYEKETLKFTHDTSLDVAIGKLSDLLEAIYEVENPIYI